MSSIVRMVHLTLEVLAVLVLLGAARPLPVSAADTTVIVSKGKPVCVHEAGNPWRRGDGYLEGTNVGNLLHADRWLGSGDFLVRARLSLEKLDGTAASLALGDNQVGFDGRGGRLFVEGPGLGPTQLLGDVSAVVRAGVPFEVVARHQKDVLSVQIDGKEIFRGPLRAAEVGLFGLRPHRGTMRVYEFSAEGDLQTIPPGALPPQRQHLFEADQDGYVTYRIPGLVVTKRGVVLAYCAARKTGPGDWDVINIALRRSTDGGRTWLPRQILVDAGQATVDNPTAIADLQTGSVHLLYQINYARCYYLRSDDDGQTFSAPADITAVFEQFRQEYNWNVIAPGPGHGIQLKNGRLLVPVWLSTGGRSHHPSCTATIYSDDHGVTWRRGDIAARNVPATPNPNESVAVELSDGRVMLNMRNESQRFRRLIAISPDGATHWSESVYDEALFEPICMAGLVRAEKRPADKIPLILFSNPDSRSKPAGPGWRARETLAIKASEDDGHTWSASRILEPNGTGYSDLTVAADGSVLCLYEDGGTMGHGSWHIHYLTLARFPIEWIYNDPAERLAKTVRIGTQQVPTASLPAGLVVRRHLGLVTSPCLNGQIVHRARLPARVLFETRATKTPGGDYLLMFPDGGHYGGNKTKVNSMLAYRSSDQGRSWTGPTVVFDIDYNQHGFIPLIPHGSKRIYAFGTQPLWNKFDGHENAAIGYRFSDDDGRTWSPVQLIEPVNDPGYRGMSVMRMCETDRGTWLLGTHEGDWTPKGKTPVVTRQYVLRSEDQGQTWTLLPSQRPGGWFVPDFERMDELRPLALGGGRVLALARTCEGHLWELRSEDDGKTWTAPKPTPLVHPDAPPMLFPLADGKTLAAFHHNVHSGGHFNMRDRSQLWVSLSTDEGRTWSEPRFVFANALDRTLASDFQNDQCSYLDMFTDGEDLHLFLPHRWQRALHLHLKAGDLGRLPTMAELEKAVPRPASGD